MGSLFLTLAGADCYFLGRVLEIRPDTCGGPCFKTRTIARTTSQFARLKVKCVPVRTCVPVRLLVRFL